MAEGLLATDGARGLEEASGYRPQHLGDRFGVPRRRGGRGGSRQLGVELAVLDDDGEDLVHDGDVVTVQRSGGDHDAPEDLTDSRALFNSRVTFARQRFDDGDFGNAAVRVRKSEMRLGMRTWETTCVL